MKADGRYATVTALTTALAATLAPCAAAAEDYVTHYTSTATKSCRAVKTGGPDEGTWSIWQCPGIASLTVRVTEDDLRMTVSVARTLAAAEKEAAATQGFSPFNSVNDTLEWRSVKSAAAPFAIIQRWLISDQESTDRSGRPLSVGLLVVTRLMPTCHAAYIDVKANADPNALARRAADETARAFDCKDKAAVVGQRGRAIALAAR
jgi:hypothetical protein